MKVENFRAYSKNSLFGFADVVLPTGMIVCGVSFHSKDGARWCGMPSREFTKEDGSKGYSPIVKFASRELADRFRDEILAAYDEITNPKPQAPSGVPKAKIPW